MGWVGSGRTPANTASMASVARVERRHVLVGRLRLDQDLTDGVERVEAQRGEPGPGVDQAGPGELPQRPPGRVR